jgi:hypothetical protein
MHSPTISEGYVLGNSQRKFAKKKKTFTMSACLYVRNNSRTAAQILTKCWIWEVLLKSVGIFQFQLRPTITDTLLTWKLTRLSERTSPTSAHWHRNCLEQTHQSESESESESRYNWQSVSQYVLVSSPIWDFWPEIFFFKVTVLSFEGALSDERSGLSFVSLLSI